ERAALARRLPAGIEHQVLDDQLVAPREQVRQGLLSVRPLERVGLVDALPRQVAPLLAQRIARPREVLLLGEQLLARLDPFLARDLFVVCHEILHAFAIGVVWRPPFACAGGGRAPERDAGRRRRRARRYPPGRRRAGRTAPASTCCSG